MRYLIIGNSAAGIFAAEEIRKQDNSGSIEILSAEDYPAYARCLTSYYLAGNLAEEQMLIRPVGFYAKNRLTLHRGEQAVKLDCAKRLVFSNLGNSYSFDKLLIATGSSPSIPNIPRVGAHGIFGLRSLEDAKKILNCASMGRRVVVVGGGLVALKAAYSLLKTGMPVTCIVSSGQVLSQLLDKEAGAMVEETLVTHGLQLKYNSEVQEFITSRDAKQGEVVRGVRLSSGEELSADVVVIGKGVKPNVAFLHGSGIELNRGILVNEFLETNIPGIYAAGDVAEGFDLLSGKRTLNAIWPNATEQGMIAGRNMSGIPTVFPGSISMNSADFFGLSTIVAGAAKAGGQDYEVVKLFSGDGSYRRLVFQADKLVGYILVGNTSHAGILTTLIREQTPLGQYKQQLQNGSFKQKILW